MRCALSFLSVLVLVSGVGLVAFLIIWRSEENFEYMWKCVNDDMYIPVSKRCDEIQDCPDKSDEDVMDCHYMEKTVSMLHRVFTSCKGNSTSRRKFEYSNFTITNDSVSSTPEPYVYAPGCTLGRDESGIHCAKVDLQHVPWKALDLNLTYLTFYKTFYKSKLVDELVVEGANNIKSLYIYNNSFSTTGPRSICNWEHLCKLVIQNHTQLTFHPDTFCSLPKLRFLDLRQNQLTLKGFQFKMEQLEDLMLLDNRIEKISEHVFRRLRKLLNLNLRNNHIRYIHEDAFKYNVALEVLNLSENRLKVLKPRMFLGQRVLRTLELRRNPLQSMPRETFSYFQNLTALHLDGVDFMVIDFDALNNIPTLDVASFKKFSYCRYVPKVTRCQPTSDGTSSLLNLLAGRSLRFIVWIVAILTIVGNVIVWLTRCFFGGGRGKVLDVFINNLAGADFLMGVYLCTIGLKDLQYRNSYHKNAHEWSTSFLCSGIGIVAMISCEVSLLILTFMSVERYLVISDPFSYHKKLGRKLARFSMVIIWLFVFVLALAPALHWQGKVSFYGGSALCFPVHLEDPYAVGWQYTSFVMIGLNSVCLAIVSISYTKLFGVIRTTRINTPPLDSKDVEMAVRFFLMVFTDCVCWLPIIILKVAALFGVEIPKGLIAWVVIFVLPINSTINPYLYTLSMPENRMKLCRRIIPAVTIRENLSRVRKGSVNILPFKRNETSGGSATFTDISRGMGDMSANANNTSSKNPDKRLVLKNNEHLNSASQRETIA